MIIESRLSILVEGPAWGDAQFYGQWLLRAADANVLLQNAKKDDAEFREAIETLEILQEINFGIMATVFVSQLAQKFHSFIVEDYGDLMEFVLMAEMGFFSRTGDRYQMTVPSILEMDTVKRAHLKLANTEDEDWIHPEQLIASTTCSRAQSYQHSLDNLTEEHRLADRRALLFLD